MFIPTWETTMPSLSGWFGAFSTFTRITRPTNWMYGLSDLYGRKTRRVRKLSQPHRSCRFAGRSSVRTDARSRERGDRNPPPAARSKQAPVCWKASLECNCATNSASTRTPASLSARSRPRRSVVVERWVAPGDWRGVDQRCGRLAVGEEAVEQAAELVDRAQMDLEEEAVLAGDAMTLADLGDLGGKLGDPRQLAGGGLDPDDRGQLVAEPAQIELGAVAGDDARPL